MQDQSVLRAPTTPHPRAALFAHSQASAVLMISDLINLGSVAWGFKAASSLHFWRLDCPPGAWYSQRWAAAFRDFPLFPQAFSTSVGWKRLLDKGEANDEATPTERYSQEGKLRAPPVIFWSHATTKILNWNFLVLCDWRQGCAETLWTNVCHGHQ